MISLIYAVKKKKLDINANKTKVMIFLRPNKDFHPSIKLHQED